MNVTTYCQVDHPAAKFGKAKASCHRVALAGGSSYCELETLTNEAIVKPLPQPGEIQRPCEKLEKYERGGGIGSMNVFLKSHLGDMQENTLALDIPGQELTRYFSLESQWTFFSVSKGNWYTMSYLGTFHRCTQICRGLLSTATVSQKQP